MSSGVFLSRDIFFFLTTENCTHLWRTCSLTNLITSRRLHRMYSISKLENTTVVSLSSTRGLQRKDIALQRRIQKFGITHVLRGLNSAVQDTAISQYIRLLDFGPVFSAFGFGLYGAMGSICCGMFTGSKAHTLFRLVPNVCPWTTCNPWMPHVFGLRSLIKKWALI